MSKELTPLVSLIHARKIAMKAHENQVYGNKPYMYHLNQVCEFVTQVNSRTEIMEIANKTGWAEDFDHRQIASLLQTCAFLHDILEDTEWTEEMLISEGFNDMVVDTVVSVTKLPEEDKQTYLERLCKNPWAVLVKKADSFANLQNCLAEGRTKGIIKYTENLLWLSGSKPFPKVVPWR